MLLIQSIFETFPEIEKHFSNLALREFLQCEFSKLYLYHFGLGTFIRNHFLKDGDLILSLFMRCGVSDRDEISYLVLQLFYLYKKFSESE